MEKEATPPVTQTHATDGQCASTSLSSSKEDLTQSAISQAALSQETPSQEGLGQEILSQEGLSQEELGQESVKSEDEPKGADSGNKPDFDNASTEECRGSGDESLKVTEESTETAKCETEGEGKCQDEGEADDKTEGEGEAEGDAVGEAAGEDDKEIEAECKTENEAEVTADTEYPSVECLQIECAGDTSRELDDFVYKMDHPKRGIAVIFNNGTFSPVVQLADRVGYQAEGTALKKAFAYLGFDVRYYEDLTVQNIILVLQLLKREGHKDVDCLCVTFLTHGLRQQNTTHDVIFGKDGPLWVDNIISKFDAEGCKSLVGKPKLFFVQASRGSLEDAGVRAKVPDTESDSGWKRKTFPLEADILLSQSAGGGYISYSDDTSGCIYAHSLARTLLDHGRTKDIHWLLTRVNGLVAAGFESSSGRRRQMPVYRSTLTKVLNFPQHTAPKPAFVL